MPVAQIVDAVSDTSHQTLFKISKLVDIPEFVKNAESDDPATIKELKQSVFADPVNRKFPCHTKAATWLSQLYFLDNRHKYPTRRAHEVQGRISKAAAFFAVDNSIKKAAARWSEHQNTAQELSSTDYAIVTDAHRALPINNPENIKAAAKTLSEKRANFPFEMRHLAARRILHAAREQQVQIPQLTDEYLHKAAGFGTTLPERAAEKLSLRILMMPKTASDERLTGAKLAKTVANMEEIPNAELVKLANIVDRIDAEFGLHKHYAEGVDTPEEIFFELTTRKAAAVRNDFVQLTTGTVFPLSEFEKLPVSKIASSLGADFLKAITSDGNLDIDLDKFARVAPTLPRSDAELLERAIEAAGGIDAPEFDSLVGE